MQETHTRSIVKALSWRVCALLITTLVAYVITHQIAFAAKIGMVDTIIKIFVYYIHERFWNNIKFGKVPPPEYQI